MFKVIIFFLFILLFSCSEKNNDNDSYDLQFVFQDSIVVDYVGNLYVTDFNKNLNLYLALDGNTILQFKENGKVDYKFTINKHGPQGIADRLDAVSFFNDTSLIVQSARSFYFYDLGGKFIDKVNLGDNPLVSTNLRYRLALSDNLIITLMMPDSSYKQNQKEFYDNNKIFTVYNLERNSLSKEIPYEKESIHRNGNYYMDSSTTLFHLSKNDSLLYVIKNPDPKIYIYNPYNKFEHVKTIDVDPDHFNEPIKIPFGTDAHPIKSLTYDGLFHNIFSVGNFIIVEYLSGLPLNSPMPASLPDLNQQIIKSSKLYYSIFKDGKKLGGDVLVPDGKFGLVHLNKEGIGLFQLDKRIDERNYEVFYKYKISY